VSRPERSGIPRKLANPAAHNSIVRKKKANAGRQRQRQSAGEEINQNRPFDRNSAKSGKIESQRKLGSTKGRRGGRAKAIDLSLELERAEHKSPELLFAVIEEKEALVRGLSGMMNRFY